MYPADIVDAAGFFCDFELLLCSAHGDLFSGTLGTPPSDADSNSVPAVGSGRGQPANRSCAEAPTGSEVPRVWAFTSEQRVDHRDSLPAGNSTAVLTETASRTGTGLVEVDESDNNTTRIVNVSRHAFVGTDANIRIAGLVVRGQNPGRYLIRGVGPSLAAAATQVGAFPLAAESKDAALLDTLALGNYTALDSGANGTRGIALVEAYERS